MTNPVATVKLEQVTKRFRDFAAVSDLSLAVHPGRIYGLIGPNGAGKTTTIRMIVNITAPDSGSIALFGKPINSGVQDRIGYLPEERGLYKKSVSRDSQPFIASGFLGFDGSFFRSDHHDY
jgi:ABC-2 type transport system ATP-binding protein